MPDGSIIGAPRRRTACSRAEYASSIPGSDKIYIDRYNMPPTYPVLPDGAVAARSQARLREGAKGRPSRPPTRSPPRSRASRSRRPLATSTWRSATATRASPRPPMASITSTSRTESRKIIDIVRYPAECVNPPPGIDADKWITERHEGRQVQLTQLMSCTSDHSGGAGRSRPCPAVPSSKINWSSSC